MNYTYKQIILALWIENSGNWDSIYKQVKAKEMPTKSALEEASKLDMDKYITIGENNYPNELKKAKKCPFVVFRG